VERLKAIFYKEKNNLSHTEKDSIERFIQNVVFEKDRVQAEIIYQNYNSYIGDLMGYATSSAFNQTLKVEMDRIHSRFNLINWS